MEKNKQRNSMITSMTGYGKAVESIEGRQITVEIKTLNAKQLDLSFKIPGLYSEFEHEIRSLITQHIERGKVFCNISIDESGDQSTSVINTRLAETYFNELRALEQLLKLPPSPDYLSLLIRLPDALKAPQEAPGEEEHRILIEVVQQACLLTNRFRITEGEVLGADIGNRILRIKGLLEQVTPFEQRRMVHIREKINKALQEGLDSHPDQNRFEQEMIYYLEKLDITEEKVRLGNHLTYFMQVMKEDSANGRKLGFIAQEVGREINTLGSKANDSEIQQIVVEMKDELEKIKEQLLNIL
jgi:uncharacterized protein (TIGR00255 family)